MQNNTQTSGIIYKQLSIYITLQPMLWTAIAVTTKRFNSSCELCLMVDISCTLKISQTQPQLRQLNKPHHETKMLRLFL